MSNLTRAEKLEALLYTASHKKVFGIRYKHVRIFRMAELSVR